MVVYGEIVPQVVAGQALKAGERLGSVTRVLKQDKNRPVAMLHLELRMSGNTADIEWLEHAEKPGALLDPTPLLLGADPLIAIG